MSKIEKWDVEDQEFWEKTGKPIATRNLIVSIPNLLCGFSVWLYWGMIAKIIQRSTSPTPTSSTSLGATTANPMTRTGTEACCSPSPQLPGSSVQRSASPTLS